MEEIWGRVSACAAFWRGGKSNKFWVFAAAAPGEYG